MHTNTLQCLSACQASTCSSQDSLSPHQLHSVHTVSIQCLSKTHKEPSPPFTAQKNLIQPPNTRPAHHRACNTSHYWARRVQRAVMGETSTAGGEQGAPLTPTSPFFLTTSGALKPALITKAIRLIFGGSLEQVFEKWWNWGEKVCLRFRGKCHRSCRPLDIISYMTDSIQRLIHRWISTFPPAAPELGLTHNQFVSNHKKAGWGAV